MLGCLWNIQTASLPQTYCNSWEKEKFNLKVDKHTPYTAVKIHPFCTSLSNFYCLIFVSFLSELLGGKKKKTLESLTLLVSHLFSFSTASFLFQVFCVYLLLLLSPLSLHFPAPFPYSSFYVPSFFWQSR